MRHRAWLCTLLAFGVAHAQTLLPSSGILYPADATGVAAISMRQLSNGLCPDTMTSSQRVTVTELTIAGARQAMLEGTLTCTELVQAYISRTNIYDQALQLNAVRELDATGALAAARAADGELRQAIANGTGHSLPSLFCVPMLLKDNIDMVGLPTTAGARGWGEDEGEEWRGGRSDEVGSGWLCGHAAWREPGAMGARRPPAQLARAGESCTRGSTQALPSAQAHAHAHTLPSRCLHPPARSGAVALADNYPATDAWVVRRLKAAGAIMLGKSNMGEFALFPSFSLSSLAGFTRNPYHLHYTPAGSSGGSAAAVSANLAMAALGTDTGNSVRGPAAHAGVVGLRPSIGLVGKTGVVPLREDRDTVGPLARTVADAAAVLGALVGLDPDDAVSAHELGAGAPLGNAPPENYTDFLEVEALAGARIGVFRQILNIPGTNVQIRSLFETALYTMQAQGGWDSVCLGGGEEKGPEHVQRRRGLGSASNSSRCIDKVRGRNLLMRRCGRRKLPGARTTHPPLLAALTQERSWRIISRSGATAWESPGTRTATGRARRWVTGT